MSTWDAGLGINFRATAGYVTNPTGTGLAPLTAGQSSAYPASLTIGSTTITCGVTAGTPGERDRDSGVDARLAGVWNDADGGANVRVFRIDVPSSGVYRLRGAWGDAANSATIKASIVDSNGSTVLATVAAGTSISTGQFIDASGVTRTSAADWVTNNAPIEVTVSGTSLFLNWGDASAQINSAISHFWIQQVVSPSAATPAFARYRVAGPVR